MTHSLETLSPAQLWKHFVALSNIPRCSRNESAVAEYVCDCARQFGLKVARDSIGNVVVYKSASEGKELSPITVLQSHLDMVGEKDERSIHDFAKDPIELMLDGQYVKANGTTLGADNGIGVAAALAVMEATDWVHGPLEFLFTVEEEIGLTGAFQVDTTLIKGRNLLNLDSEEEGTVYIGCAGGMESMATKKISLVEPSPEKNVFCIKVSGLKGGHSGMDIARGRGNSIQILGRVLWTICSYFEIELFSIQGGNKGNAIPREAFAQFYMDSSLLNELQKKLSQLQADMRNELETTDSELDVRVEKAEAPQSKVWPKHEAETIIAFLRSVMHGFLALDPDIPGLVQTSTNLAIVKTTGDHITIVSTHRSSVDSAKKDVADRFAACCKLAGFEEKRGERYPGWKPNKNSALLKTTRSTYWRLFGRELQVKAVHAGLECGVLGDRFPGIDALSLGPTIENAHSPQERVHTPSVEAFWKFLQGLLADI